MSFNSSEVFVRGHAINNVEGNQVNHSQAITAEVVHINSQREIERTEYDEFEEVKRGQIYTLKQLHTEEIRRWWEWEWELEDGELVRKRNRSTQRTICTVQVRPDQQTKYTAVIYEGNDADFFWKRDFERFSRAGLGKPEVWQLYGLNRSKIPFLIFHDVIVAPPDFELSTPRFGHQRYPIAFKDLPSVYLFIYSPPLSISERISWEKGHTQTHFWSLDKNGQSEMSEEECRRWGIPELGQSLHWHSMELLSWPTDVYTALCKWQVARGFDPTTADWAQSQGCTELEVIGGKEEEARFEGVHDYVSYLRKLHEQAQMIKLNDILESTAFLCDPSLHSPESTPRASHLDEQGLPEQNDSSSVQETPKEETKRASWWSWEAVTGSGISAFMC
ncbi:hypothetical protein VNI00_015716 [Paramarasmius palmivorus]|uniref:Uncharacterized protein n=1 Tax=Paramarasmius palmivorus TaxID=297713 RepID=A0AAW0BIY8_9AGAR